MCCTEGVKAQNWMESNWKENKEIDFLIIITYIIILSEVYFWRRKKNHNSNYPKSFHIHFTWYFIHCFQFLFSSFARPFLLFNPIKIQCRDGDERDVCVCVIMIFIHLIVIFLLEWWWRTQSDTNIGMMHCTLKVWM